MSIGSTHSAQDNHLQPSPRSLVARRARGRRIGPIRRWTLRLALIGSIWGIALWRFPAEADLVSWTIRNTANEFAYRNKIQFVGLARLRAEDLEVLLPTERPFWWWLVSSTSVEQALVAHPLVKEARVERCSWVAMKCFSISITERAPVALMKLHDEWWLMGDDGGTIGPVSEDGRSNSPLPVVDGLDQFDTTPQVLTERFVAAWRLLAMLQSRGVNGLKFIGGDEVVVGFGPERPEVLFELDTQERVAEQLARLAEVEAQLGKRLPETKRVDLALRSQAVVTFKESAPPKVKAGAPKGSQR